MNHSVKRQSTPPKGSRPIRPHLSDETVESIAAWLRVISEPTRIRIMELLNCGPVSVQGLAAQLGMTYYNVSKHLNVLHQAGIVSRRIEDNRIHYELVDWSGWWMVEQAGMSLAAEASEPGGDSPTSTA